MESTLVLLLGPFLVGYLLGSIPFGLLLTRAAGLGGHPQGRIGQYRRHQCAAHRPQGAGRSDPAARCLEGRRGRVDLCPRQSDRCHRRRRRRRAWPHVPGVAAFQGRQGRRDHARHHVGPVLAGRGHRLCRVAAVRGSLALFVTRRPAQRRDRRDRRLVPGQFLRSDTAHAAGAPRLGAAPREHRAPFERHRAQDRATRQDAGRHAVGRAVRPQWRAVVPNRAPSISCHRR